MLRELVVRVVLWCWLRPVPVVVLGALASLALGFYAGTHLSLDTDESRLISSDLPFRRAERAFDEAFPEGDGGLVVVVEGETVAAAEEGALRLMRRLEGEQGYFRSVRLPPGTEFFQREGLLYLSLDQLTKLSDQMIDAQPLIGSLARDTSLRGLLAALDLALEGVERGEATMADLEPALARLGDTASAVLAGRPKPLPWRELFGIGGATADRPARALLLVRPVLDYTSLVPGRRARDAIRRVADDLGLTPEHGFGVRLTGSVALTDDNFATVAEGVEISTPLSTAAVGLLLLWAVRSKRVVVANLLCLTAGLVATAAFAAATVGTLNPISVAFAVMFVGMAVDFGIQFSIRVRDEQHHLGDPQAAMAAGARGIAGPLSLAAATTAVGFLSFLPTAYRGVAQLGLIAGAGMAIALVVNLTLLPALLALLKPRPERQGVGLPGAAPLDRFLHRRARGVVVVAGLGALAGAALLPSLHFDFNPLNLQNPAAESVRAFRDLARDPDTSPYGIDLLAPTADAAAALAQRIEALPEVDHTVTIFDLVPMNQPDKLAIVADLGLLLGPTLDPAAKLPPPTADETRAALIKVTGRLRAAAPPAQRLATLLDGVLAAGPATVAALERQVTTGLPALLDDLRRLLAPAPITQDSLPPDLTRRWLAPDGRARVEVVPKGDMQDARVLRRFVEAVQAVAPDATGMPVAIAETGRVVVTSFITAGLLALAAITLLLGAMLRRLSDVVLVVLPLVMGALYTVVGVVASGLAINFANIIALPLLLGIGVAYNIYFVVNRRHGVRDPLATPTSRAVLFSALTTGSAFGALAVSPHLGTASMGLLLSLSLGMTVLTTFLVLPAIFTVLDDKERP